jgi:hypothetical protein
LPKFGKKWFSKQGLTCSFCLGKGHENYFCPAAPYRPEAKHRVPFVEKILNLKRVKTNRFLGLSWGETRAWIEKNGASWNEGNPWTGSEKIFDRLRAKLGYWRAIGASDSVISWLGYGVPVRFVQQPRHRAFKNHKLTEEEAAYVDKDVKKHVESGCFIPAPPGSVKISNPILCVHQGEKIRRCDDCRYGNAYQASPKFKMCSLKTDVPLVVRPGDIQIAKDLEKAYYKVPLAPQAQPYLAFSWKGLYFLTMVMLFGMCQAPFYFTKICRPIVRLFGAVKLPAVSFIDDWFWSPHKGKKERAETFIAGIFSILGWSFNDKDQEGTRIQFLGLIIDSVKREFVAPEKKIEKIRKLIAECVAAATANKRVHVDTLASLCGSALSVSLAIPGVSTWTRSLYAQQYQGTPTVFLSVASMEELGVLDTMLVLSNGSPFTDPEHDKEMWVDTGEVGWGASIDGIEVRGHMPEEIIGTSSTARELFGLASALESDQVWNRIKGKVILLNMDSMCSVRNLVKGGGPVEELVEWVKIIWKLCERGKIKLVPRWLRRSTLMMQRVDALSKTGTRWLLDPVWALGIQQKTGFHPMLPDLSRCGPAVKAAVSRQEKTVLVLPRWEGKTWWNLAFRCCTQQFQVDNTSTAILPNLEMGLPRWDFHVFVFN